MGKLQNALAIISNENTLALANINFDFSLFKIEAPIEFQALGAALSTQRRANAEDGIYHQTARRLGALFDQVLPPTPQLVRAYGQRCSDISQMPYINPKGSKIHGIFEQQVGADGTTIWAAATSGASAVAVHLLACMLARIWPSDKATSVWVELVNKRKAMIKAEDNGLESQSWSSLMASQQTISRKELASWDASARAWLRRADEAMNSQQIRLMLIIKNVSITVNNIGDTYESVLQAWRISLTTMEKIMKGMPQLVQNGAVLLALSAWHLYPDLNVLKEASKIVSLEDKLIARGGIITIGTEDANTHPDGGVRWSLPLAYLRYYGEPVQSSAALCQATERVSVAEVAHVILGCILGGWGCTTRTNAAKALRVLAQIVISRLHDIINGAPSWPKLILVAADRYCSSKDTMRKQYDMLQRLGMRTTRFLGAITLEPYFGLTQYSALSRLCKDQECRISILRKLASGLEAEKELIIKYRLADQKMANRKDTSLLGWHITHGLATAVKSKKRDIDGNVTEDGSFRRWMVFAKTDTKLDAMDVIDLQKEWQRKGGIESEDNYCPDVQRIWNQYDVRFPGDREDYGGFTWFKSSGSQLSNTIESSYIVDDAYYGTQMRQNSPSNKSASSYRHVYGDPGEAALYICGELMENNYQFIEEARSTGIEIAFESDYIDPAKFLDFIETMPVDPDGEFNQSMRGLCIATEVYENIPGATLSLQVINEPLWRAHWIPKADPSRSVQQQWANWRALQMTRAEVFSCIAFFESGIYNISPDGLQSVMAISSGDSIYVAAALLVDPHEIPKPTEIRRVIGNVDCPGIAMLIPPTNLMLRKPNPAQYWLIKHDDFDGNLVDEFSQTQLELSFTGWEQSINIGSYGSCDNTIYFLETLIKMYDAGQWLADLDILSSLNSELIHRCYCYCGFDGSAPAQTNSETVDDVPQPLNVVALDNWEELLQRPEENAIVRAHGNWVARLAGTCLSMRHNYPTYILPCKANKVCWSCIGEMSSLPPEAVFIS
ncbi:hypothetical protein F5884DRAFT_686581 [Xylogone sp. PMI_703]|nr:hypothetical protein F5884DRAFT_686581 [Xylogone sp. PMI_703]